MPSLLSHSFLPILVCIWSNFSLNPAQHTGGFINTMPTCWQTCFQTTFPNCHDQLASDAALDCICPHATGSTFTALTSCVKQGCDADSDPNVFISPLKTWQTACKTDGHPLSDEAVESAEDAEQSVLATYTGPNTLPTTTSTGPVVSSITGASAAARTTSSSGASSSAPKASTKTASSASASATKHSDSSDGSPLDVTNQATKKEARSLLGLTVGILAGIIWF